MILTPLQKILEKQGLILSLIKDKLDILNFLLWGYNDDIPILMDNPFFHYTAHIYYRTIVVELCTLFDDNKYQANNFYNILNTNKKYNRELSNEAKEKLLIHLIDANNIFSNELKDLRNEEISHYTLKNGSKIKFNFDHKIELNYLFELGSKIILIAGLGFQDESKNREFHIGTPNVNLRSLQRLLKMANNYDYENAWKFELE